MKIFKIKLRFLKLMKFLKFKVQWKSFKLNRDFQNEIKAFLFKSRSLKLIPDF